MAATQRYKHEQKATKDNVDDRGDSFVAADRGKRAVARPTHKKDRRQVRDTGADAIIHAFSLKFLLLLSSFLPILAATEKYKRAYTWCP